jgi:hypothetical protein
MLRPLIALIDTANEPDDELLLTLDQQAVPRTEQLTRLGLSRREGEVLAAAARKRSPPRLRKAELF